MGGDENVSPVINNGLCTGCGACVALCPKGALEISVNKDGTYISTLDNAKCAHCGICSRVCPGQNVNLSELSTQVFGDNPINNYLGKYLSCYIGYTSESNIRFHAASGGLISSLLIYSLDKGIIDGALVTRMKKDSPLEPEPFIARTKDEILEAARSKYCPVPLNVALRQILDAKTGEKFAVVGLPCHIHAVRKAEITNRQLKDKIVLHFGLLCGGTHSFHATDMLLRKMRIPRETVSKLDYRGGGFPGRISAWLNNGDKISVPFIDYFNPIFGPRFFRPIRCNFCPDGTAELADISFGDAWTKECKANENIGQSIAIVRTTFGEGLINSAMADGLLNLQRLSDEELKQATEGMLKSKKKHVNLCIQFAKNIQRKQVPKFDFKLGNTKVWSIPVGLLPYFNSYIGRNKYGRKLIGLIPLQVLKIYHLALAGYFRYLC